MFGDSMRYDLYWFYNFPDNPHPWEEEYDPDVHIAPGMAYAVRQDGKWGIRACLDNHWITPCQWDILDAFYYGRARVKLDGKYGFIDTDGNEISPCQWNDAHPFFRRVCRSKDDRKMGFY